jgi:hypothetical protein
LLAWFKKEFFKVLWISIGLFVVLGLNPVAGLLIGYAGLAVYRRLKPPRVVDSVAEKEIVPSSIKTESKVGEGSVCQKEGQLTSDFEIKLSEGSTEQIKP